MYCLLVRYAQLGKESSDYGGWVLQKLEVHLIINISFRRKFQVRKHNESWIGIIWRDLIMETKVFDRSVKLCRVEGSNLDPRKHWYVLTESLCGIRPNAFAKSEIFRRFPDEIRSVPPAGPLSPPKMAVHSTPGNQATRILFLRLVSVPDYLDRDNLQHMDLRDLKTLFL